MELGFEGEKENRKGSVMKEKMGGKWRKKGDQEGEKKTC